MTGSGYVYCILIGVCNLLIFRECWALGVREAVVQNIKNPRIRLGASAGLAITLIGGVAHRTAGFTVDVGNPWAWVIAMGFPLLAAYPFRTKLDPGWVALQKGKAAWQRLPITVDPGTIDPGNAQYRSHPSVAAAKKLIQAAIDQAPRSNTDPIVARANAAIARQELGLLCRAINDLDEARRHLEASLAELDRLTPGDSRHPRVLESRRDALFRLGELAHVTGDHRSAKRRYTESLEIDALLGHDDSLGENITKDLLRRLPPVGADLADT